MEKKFEKSTFGKRMSSMLSVDFKRAFISPFTYIMLGVAIVIPILVIVMVSMMEGSPMTDQNQQPILDEFGNPVLMEGFKSVWQIVGTLSTNNAMSMDLTGMCNINMMYFAVAVFVCIFIANDFRSGYSKNLFAVRAKNSEYIISKTLVSFVVGALMIILFLIGSMLAGAMMGLPFAMEGFNAGTFVMCMISKILLLLVFVSIFVCMSVMAKQRTWLSMCLSLAVGMLLFMMIPMLTPLDAGFMNVILCLAGGLLFAFGLGSISRLVLKKKDIL